MIYFIIYLIRKYKDTQHPVIQRTLTEEQLNNIVGFVNPLQLEEKLYLIREVIGSGNVLLNVSLTGITLQTYDKGISDDEDEPLIKKYTG